MDVFSRGFDAKPENINVLTGVLLVLTGVLLALRGDHLNNYFRKAAGWLFLNRVLMQNRRISMF